MFLPENDKTAVSRIAVAIIVIVVVVIAGVASFELMPGTPTSSSSSQSSSSSTSGFTTSTASTPVSSQTTSAGTKVVTLALVNTINNLDPPDSNNADNLNVDLAIYDNLVRFDQSMNIIPDLATSWTLAPDQITWTFHLRQGVRFSDGSPLNATAVKINLDRDRNASSTLSHSSLFTMINETKVVDTYTIQVTTSYPFAALLNNLAHPSGGIISPAAIAKYGKAVASNPDGSGPFEVKSMASNEVVLVRNPYYWGNTTNVGQINIMTVTDSSTALSMLQSGQADVIESVPPSSATTVANTPGLKLVVSHGEVTRFVGFNVDVKPFSDLRVRQAMNYAINRTALIETVYKGYALPPTSPAAPDVTGYAPVTPFYNYNLTKAEELLSAAGYANGFNTTMWSENTPTAVLLAQAVASMLAQVHIQVSIQTYTFGTEIGMLTKPANQSQTQLYQLRWFPSSGDAYWVLWPLFNTAAFPPAGYNYGFFSNATIDNVVNQGLQTVNGRQAYFTQAQQMIVQQAPWIFLLVEDQLTGMKSSITGVQIWPANAIYFNNIAVSS